MPIGSRLKQLLNERGLTVKDFANQIGVPPTTLYSFIKRDSNNAKMDLILKICTGLQIDSDELIGSDEAAVIDIANNPSKWGLGNTPQTIAAHFDGDEYTEEELEEIRKFAEFVKSKRKYSVLNAAHALSNATQEDIQHDEDIMNDENF